MSGQLLMTAGLWDFSLPVQHQAVQDQQAAPLSGARPWQVPSTPGD